MGSKALALPPNLTVEKRKSKGHEAEHWEESTPTSCPKRQPSLRHGQIPETLMGLGLWGLRGQGSLTQHNNSTKELEDKGYQAEDHCHRSQHWISEGSTPALHPCGNEQIKHRPRNLDNK